MGSQINEIRKNVMGVIEEFIKQIILELYAT